jgi:hypothetical protein
MTTTRTFTAGPDSVAAERFVNAAVWKGEKVTVNGVTVHHRFGAPSRSWGNGSFSWDSRSQSTSGTRKHWAKRGEAVRVTVTADEATK